VAPPPGCSRRPRLPSRPRGAAANNALGQGGVAEQPQGLGRAWIVLAERVLKTTPGGRYWPLLAAVGHQKCGRDGPSRASSGNQLPIRAEPGRLRIPMVRCGQARPHRVAPCGRGGHSRSHRRAAPATVRRRGVRFRGQAVPGWPCLRRPATRSLRWHGSRHRAAARIRPPRAAARGQKTTAARGAWESADDGHSAPPWRQELPKGTGRPREAISSSPCLGGGNCPGAIAPRATIRCRP